MSNNLYNPKKMPIKAGVFNKTMHEIKGALRTIDRNHTQACADYSEIKEYLDRYGDVLANLTSRVDAIEFILSQLIPDCERLFEEPPTCHEQPYTPEYQVTSSLVD
jgi:hypothetical protein